LERDSRVFYHQLLSTPVAHAIARAEGAYLYDTEGNALLDLHGNGVHTVGYNNPRVLAAARRQMEEALTFSPRRFTNEPAVALAEKLVAAAPEGLSRALFCPGGSEAIEMAVMLAKLATGRWKTLSYYGAFHGAGFQAVSIGADPHFRDGLGPMMPGALHLELPDYYRNPWGWTDTRRIDDEYLRQLQQQLAYNPEVAALIAEPVFYNSTVPTLYYWQQVKELCVRHGALLIFDEIYTALGRTGRFFACEHYVTPDILVVGKGLGGSLVPFAGIIGRDDLNVLDHKSIGHYTHEKNSFCSAIAAAVVDYVHEAELPRRAAELGAYFRDGLLALQQRFPCIGNVSGLGLNLAVDLVEDPHTRARAPQLAGRLMDFCFARGVSFKLIQGNILNLKPALVIEKTEIDRVLEVLEEGLSRLLSVD
jgi:4-aminobutyrate aminotransferase